MTTMKLKELNFFTSHKEEHVFDSLTKTINKDYFLKYAEALIKSNAIFSIYFIDIDNFKNINDNLGHVIADKVLIDIAQLLDETCQNKGLLSRYEGDQFALIFPNITSYEDVWNIGRDIEEKIRHYQFDYLSDSKMNSRITLTIGIARYPIDATDLNLLLSNADKALFRGKRKGKNCFIIFNKNLHGNIDIDNNKANLNTQGLTEYIFDMNKLHSKDDALGMISHMLGNYYSDNSLFKINGNTPVLLYHDSLSKPLNPLDIDISSLFTDSSETYHIYYISLLNPNNERDKKLIKMMNERKIRSFILFRFKDKDNSVLLVDSMIEKIWLESEINLYSTMIYVYTLLDKND